MALFEIAREGDWPEGDLAGALVIAPSKEAALDKVRHLIQDPADVKHYLVKRLPVSGAQVTLLWTQLGGDE